jgi:hypothetical protein
MSGAIEGAQRELNDLGYQMGITALYVVVSEALVLQERSSCAVRTAANFAKLPELLRREDLSHHSSTVTTLSGRSRS